MKHSRYNLASALFGALLVLVLGGLAADAQQITGTIVGTVRDSQGAMVTSATITATNVETSFSRSTKADSQGAYLIQYLPVGNYTVEVDTAGFKKFVQKNLVITVDQAQTLDVRLIVGGESQTVTVSDAPPLVNTETAELGRTVDSAEITGLPLVNRNAYSELSLTPGVMENSASDSGNPNGTPNFVLGVPSTQVIINGGIDNGVPMVSFYLDGGINMTGIRSYGNPLPNPDALQEFRVETSNFAAQYGRMSAGVVSAVTKSGTNQFHGSLFEFDRNNDFNAYYWKTTTKAPYHRNNFGGTVGGPVKHNKAFFFGSYAGLRQVIGQQLIGSVFTTGERIGDFTGVSNKVYMPGTKTQVMGTNSSPNCGTPTLNCIPSSLLDKTAATLLANYIPEPNDGPGTYSGFYSAPTNQDEYLAKYDETISNKDHAAASFFYLNTLQYLYGGGDFPYMQNQSFAKQYNTNINETHAFSATTMDQAWLTYTRIMGGRYNLPTGIGLDNLGSTFTTEGVKALPELNVSGYFTAGSTLAGPASDSNFYTLRDLVNKTVGKHSFGFGAEGSMEKDLTIGDNNNNGNFAFSTSAPTTTGFVPSDFVTGQVATMEQDTPYTADMSQWYYAFYVQDYYRLTQKLTLSLGLRWDVQTAPVEARNRVATFIPGVQSTAVPTAPLGMLFPGDAGVPRGVTDNRYHHLSPRIGVVWDPFGDGKTAIRAGAGVFYGSVVQNEWAQPSGSQPFAVRQSFNSITSLSNVYGNPGSFPNGDPFPYVYSPTNTRFLPAAGIAGTAENFQWPLVYQINAAVQRQLPGSISLTTAYVATLSHDLPFMIDANYAPYAAGANTTQASINARRPYDSGVLGQISFAKSIGTASYHSLQIMASRPMTHNLQFSGFYVLSHNLQSADESLGSPSVAQDFDNLWEERGPTDFDRRQMAAISGIWNIDYYQRSGRLVKQILNGWTLSTIALFQSGPPVNITTGTDANFDSANNNRPDLVAGVSPFLDPHRNRFTAASAWFNTAAFVKNGPGVAGGLGPGDADGNAPRDYLRAPGFRTVNMGLHRDFDFEHNLVFQFRCEATNAFNLVSLNPPTATLSSPSNGAVLSASTPRIIQLGARLTF